MKRKNEIRKVSLLSLIGNTFLLAIKFLIGLMFNSQSMIADATNSAGDVFASVVALIGNKISAEPADEDHNMGHGKAEYFFSLIIGIAMLVASFLVIANSINNLLTHNHYIFSKYLIFVCIITIIVKLSLYIYTRISYKKNNSVLIKSIMKDHQNDCLITLASLISISLSYLNIYFLDSIVGISISIVIIITGLKIIFESYQVLIDQSIDEESKNKIVKTIESYSGSIKMGTMSSIPIGYKFIVVATIFVDGNMTTKEAHDITKILQKDIKRKISKIDRVIIHVNPIE